MSGIYTFVGLIILAYIALRVFWSQQSEKKFGSLREKLPDGADYVFEGFNANRVGHNLRRIALGVYQSRNEICVLFDNPDREFGVGFDEIVDVRTGEYEAVGKTRSEIVLTTNNMSFLTTHIGWDGELYSRLKAIAN